jgi:hypothetical protein
VNRFNQGHDYNKQIKFDIVAGKKLHSRLATFAQYHAKPEWDVIWLWQCWQERVTAHLKGDEDRQGFVRLKCTLSDRVGSSAYLADRFARELQSLENLLKSCESGAASEKPSKPS